VEGGKDAAKLDCLALLSKPCFEIEEERFRKGVLTQVWARLRDAAVPREQVEEEVVTTPKQYSPGRIGA